MVKVAVVQQPPVYLDLAATMERAVGLVAEAAGQGAGLVVFPEAWFPGYPTFVWRLKPSADMGKTDALYTRLVANAVDLSRDGLKPLRDAAREHGTVVVAGLQELDGAVSGTTVYNTVCTIDATGDLLNTHRKLMPTNPERMVWGFGDARGLRVVETAAGRIGALLCWENYMPLARYALYGQNLEILVAPTWDTGDGWLSTMRHIAREGGCWVIGCSTTLEAADIPEDVPHRDVLFPDPAEWINDGDAVVMKPFGGPVAGPMRREKGILLAEIDTAAVAAARRKFDVAGHYARPDVFTLSVDRSPREPVRLRDAS